ncbi:hypothetical protein ACFTWH_00195 [Streptomyces sp. NPDC057011]|uniref:hypothetical protein n=1 Tax=unclassified Streptomyces TaxID=2593676 RepID=UPI0036282AB2
MPDADIHAPEPELGTPFADLVREARAERKWSFRDFAEAAVDPATGYSPSHTTVWNIEKGNPVKVSPALVRAVAVVVPQSLREVQIAAAAQYIGMTTSTSGAERAPLIAESSGERTVVAHVPGLDLTAEEMPLVRKLLEKIDQAAQRAS